ncbi:hypothetical protein HNR06_001290 [Nocardiopsis arvandica]|uniref:DUF3040 domain-containing protein n=1 Tax=Nocardiopsis sinuspersici TaxID=501010 RepID=A0A7Y9X9I0_9ACTN|nr:hypothetical protein [Nocardiopsis sinuspersici]NYH51701.1 hypothetical protein [Nocardiopsis sinuspersici]
MRTKRNRRGGESEDRKAPDSKELLTPSPRSPDDVAKEVVGETPVLRKDAVEDDPALAWETEHPDGSSRFGRIQGFQRQGGSMAPSNAHRGRLSSWVAVVLACAGFTVGGLAVAMGMSVVLLVVAGVLLLAAGVVALFFDMMSDVVLDTPRKESEEPHDTPLHRLKRESPGPHSE